MPILNVVPQQIGAVGIVPNIAFIATNDTLAEVTATGYLNHVQQNGASLAESTMCLVSTKTSPSAAATQVGWLEVSHVGANWSLVQTGAPGTVTLPTIANHIATYTNTVGQLSEDPATAITGGNLQAGLSGTAGYLASFPATAAKGSFRVTAVANTGDTLVTLSNALHGQASVYSIPDSGASTANLIISKLTGTQHITVGAFQVDAGVISSGIATGGTAGGFIAYPATTTQGSLRLTPVGNVGNFAASVSNISTLGQATVYTIPDPGAATANFLLDTGASNILAQQQFVGLSNVLAFSVGTWTTTRIALGNYGSVKSQADETAVIGVDITPIIRTAASKGFRLDSFDVIYGIATLALDAHSVTLSRVAYENNVAVSVTSVPVTATLATATQANPYVTAATVDTPAFDITTDSKYVIEVTVDAGATSDYTYYGVMLKFSQTIA